MAGHILTCKILPESLYVPNTSQLSWTLSPKNHPNISWITIYMTFKNSVVWRDVSHAHGTQRAMAVMAVPCAYDTPRQITAFVNVRYAHFTIYSRDSVEMKCTEAEKWLRRTRILAVSCLCRQILGSLWDSVHTVQYSSIVFALGFRTRIFDFSTELCASR